MTFTAIVAAAAPGSGAPTGEVKFFDDGQLMGVGTLTVVNGVDQATFSTSALGFGDHSILVKYTGDEDFAKSAIAGSVGPCASSRKP